MKKCLVNIVVSQTTASSQRNSRIETESQQCISELWLPLEMYTQAKSIFKRTMMNVKRKFSYPYTRRYLGDNFDSLDCSLFLILLLMNLVFLPRSSIFKLSTFVFQFMLRATFKLLVAFFRFFQGKPLVNLISAYIQFKSCL